MRGRGGCCLIRRADESESNRSGIFRWYQERSPGRRPVREFVSCLLRLFDCPFTNSQRKDKAFMIIYAICLAVGLIFTIFSAATSPFFGGHDFGGHAGDVG